MSPVTGKSVRVGAAVEHAVRVGRAGMETRATAHGEFLEALSESCVGSHPGRTLPPVRLVRSIRRDQRLPRSSWTWSCSLVERSTNEPREPARRAALARGVSKRIAHRAGALATSLLVSFAASSAHRRVVCADAGSVERVATESASGWEHVVRVAGRPALPGRAELWARRVSRALRREGAALVEPGPFDWERPGFAERRLDDLEAVAAALASARRALVALDEAAALGALASAAAQARALLDVPGAAGWLAEVEIATAIVATQRGEHALAEASLRRALALSSDRLLEEGEAPPELVAVARALARGEARRSRLTVRARGEDAVGVLAARLFVDDRLEGPLPRDVELSAGFHVFRIEAPGHRPYARSIELAPGPRPPLEVRLAPSPVSLAALALERAILEGQPSAVASALASIVAAGGVERVVWLVFVGTGPLDRAVVVRCTPGVCGPPLRLEDTARFSTRGDGNEEPSLSSLDGVLPSARVWLDEVPRSLPLGRAEEPWWPWVGAATAVALAVGVGIAVAVSPESAPPLVLRIDPCTGCAR